MSTHTVTGNVLSGLKKDAARAVRQLPLPGKPDEAWRRVPPDAVRRVCVPSGLSRFSDGKKSGGVTVSLSGDGTLYCASGGENEIREVESALHIWRSREAARAELRLPRPNDAEQNLAALLNIAWSNDVYVLRLAEKMPEGNSFSRLHVGLDSLCSDDQEQVYLPLIIVHAQEGSATDLKIELHRPPGAVLPAVFQIVYLIDTNASLTSYAGFSAAENIIQFGFEHAYLEAGGHLKINREFRSTGCIMTDGRYALMGEASGIEHYSVGRPAGAGFIGQKVVVEQYAPRTLSTVENRSVLTGRGRIMNVGTIKIPAGAGGSEAREEYRSLMLSPEAKVESLPELEIVENDVSCSHSAGISELSDEDIFYLESRGIRAGDARDLLTDAFIEELQSKMFPRGTEDNRL